MDYLLVESSHALHTVQHVESFNQSAIQITQSSETTGFLVYKGNLTYCPFIPRGNTKILHLTRFCSSAICLFRSVPRSPRGPREYQYFPNWVVFHGVSTLLVTIQINTIGWLDSGLAYSNCDLNCVFLVNITYDILLIYHITPCNGSNSLMFRKFKFFPISHYYGNRQFTNQGG